MNEFLMNNWVGFLHVYLFGVALSSAFRGLFLSDIERLSKKDINIAIYASLTWFIYYPIMGLWILIKEYKALPKERYYD